MQRCPTCNAPEKELQWIGERYYDGGQSDVQWYCPKCDEVFKDGEMMKSEARREDALHRWAKFNYENDRY